MESFLSSTKTSKGDREGLVSVLVCPAQFCVPDDYKDFFQNLQEISGKEGISKFGQFEVAPLPRTEWIKVARQLPTKAFWQAELDVPVTLQWYFDAIEDGISNILARDPNARICLCGHSIGGWVARAWLGGLSESSSAAYRVGSEKVTSLVTLGTPHSAPPEESPLAIFDQTRGLLKAIDKSDSCSASALKERGIRVTNVISDALSANLLTTDIEQIVAATSYLPLTGSFSEKGDGIVPISIGFMEEPAERIVLSECRRTGQAIRHSHVLPTPWNLWDGESASVTLETAERPFPSYVSKGVVEQWAQCIV